MGSDIPNTSIRNGRNSGESETTELRANDNQSFHTPNLETVSSNNPPQNLNPRPTSSDSNKSQRVPIRRFSNEVKKNSPPSGMRPDQGRPVRKKNLTSLWPDCREDSEPMIVAVAIVIATGLMGGLIGGLCYLSNSNKGD